MKRTGREKVYKGPGPIEEIREEIRRAVREKERTLDERPEVFTVRIGLSERFFDGLQRLKEAVVTTPLLGKTARKFYHFVRRR